MWGSGLSQSEIQKSGWYMYLVQGLDYSLKWLQPQPQPQPRRQPRPWPQPRPQPWPNLNLDLDPKLDLVPNLTGNLKPYSNFNLDLQHWNSPIYVLHFSYSWLDNMDESGNNSVSQRRQTSVCACLLFVHVNIRMHVEISVLHFNHANKSLTSMHYLMYQIYAITWLQQIDYLFLSF